MHTKQNLFLLFTFIIALLLGFSYYSYTSSWFSDVFACRPTVDEKRHVQMDLLFPTGTACKQPSVSSSRPDVATTSQWLAPIVWEDTFDLTVIDAIYKQQNITVATTVFALGKYVRFLKDLLESAEQHFMVGYRVHYYIFTDLPDEVPAVTLGEGRQLKVIKTASMNRWQEISLRRMERIENLIQYELINKVDYIFSLDVDSIFYAHWGAESLGDLVGVLHAGFFGSSREQFTYERRPESQAYIPLDEGDYYYGGAMIGGRPEKVLKLVKTCRMQLDVDRANKIEAVWQEESHLNKYFLYNKPTKLLSPEYLWDDRKEKPGFMKVVRFSQVVKNYAEIRPNP
ncbi:globoside alpha-1,3-N-acetylgalactosaminyltransferase 1-like isoform X2 [Tachysurus fulvidraco]|uniref:globoside alpha-1,3-N-acetylgalactosaminyltransferase 1-like isoform X2 n=1 Tax=Tachysurus fulvidraco TaxID=1234273 RepID=UPI001FEF051B|nr:globoside alpha-1,3-N-acetylgalactosaminyltransferase 1-like isoform X2 [Tachysurus fulvidraco]